MLQQPQVFCSVIVTSESGNHKATRTVLLVDATVTDYTRTQTQALTFGG